MTVRVNLLPLEYRLRAKRPQRLKLWVALSAVMVVAQVMAATFLRMRSRETRAIQEQVRRMHDHQNELIKELAQLTVRKRDLAKQIALNERLRRKHLWSQVLSTLTGRLPDHVVLTSLASDPPRDLHTAAEVPVAAGPIRSYEPGQKRGARAGAAGGLLIDGIAADHASVAAFIGALSGDGLLGTCELKSTNRQPFLNDYAVAFTVSVQW